MLGLVRIKIWERRNGSNVYWSVVKVCVGSIQLVGIETFYFLRYWNILSSKFIKILNYIKSLCIIFMLNWFKHLIKNQIIFCLKNCQYFRRKYVPGDKMFQYPLTVYHYTHQKNFLKGHWHHSWMKEKTTY